MILLHPTANASTIMDNFKDKFQKFKIKSTGENIVAYRKYGHKVKMIRITNTISFRKLEGQKIANGKQRLLGKSNLKRLTVQEAKKVIKAFLISFCFSLKVKRTRRVLWRSTRGRCVARSTPRT